MAELILSQAKFTMKIVPLASNCPKFEKVKLLPYQVQSVVSAEAFQVFVSALGGADPALTTENMNDLLLLCEEFGFASLLSQVTDFILTHSVVDSEGSNGAADITEENLQIKEALCPLQEALSGVHKAHFHLAQSTDSL
jgi:hypothetical protein